jgi:hypothetical protein
MLHFTLAISKLVYASMAWNTLTYADANELESYHRKLLALFYSRFFYQIHYSYDNTLEHVNLHTSCNRRHHLYKLLLVSVYSGCKFCPSLFETVGIHVTYRNFAVSSVCCKFFMQKLSL